MSEVDNNSSLPSDHPEIESIKPKQGKVTGVIIPPPEIRAIADKTAQFVARNGKSFETKIQSSEEGKTAKFNFMKPFDPYHAYYEYKIREFEEAIANGGVAKPIAPVASATVTVDVSSKPVVPSTGPVNGTTTAKTSSTTTTSAAKSSLISPITKFAMLKTPTSPNLEVTSVPNYEFSVGVPAGISMLDLDIIKLTAQYTAANGRDFLAGIAQRELRNPQFDFLKPTHLLFSYFTTLVDNYSKILHPTKQLKDKLQITNQKLTALEYSIHQWKFNKNEHERKLKETHNANEEKIAFQSIDWHDFVVVETIDFDKSELMDYPVANLLGPGVGFSSASTSISATSHIQHIPVPPPPSISMTSTMKGGTSRMITQQQQYAHSTNDDMDMDMDEDTAPVKPPTATVTASTSGTRNTGGTGMSGYLDDNDMDMETDQNNGDDDDDVQLKVVSDYRPRMAPTMAASSTSGSSGAGSAVSTSISAGGGMTMIDPISGKAIPVNEMAEHMRVSLLDPKWRTEQQRFQEKQRETGFAEGSSIADSLKQFARRRSDIFGGSVSGSRGGMGDDQDGDNDADDDKEATDKIQWDGHQNSIALAQAKQREMAMRAPEKPVTIPLSSAPAVGPQFPTPSAPVSLSLPVPTVPATAVIPPPPPLMTSTTLPPPPPMIPVPAVPVMAPPTMIRPPPVPLMSVMPAMGMPVVPAAVTLVPVPIPPMIPPMPPVLSTTVTHVQSTATTQGSAKKSRADNELIPAEEFLATHTSPITVQVTVPVESTSGSTVSKPWGLNGQTIKLNIESVNLSVKELKEIIVIKIKESGNGAEMMPLNKFQLKIIHCGALLGQNGPNYGIFLKDSNSLAAHNIDEGYMLEVSIKSRR